MLLKEIHAWLETFSKCYWYCDWGTVQQNSMLNIFFEIQLKIHVNFQGIYDYSCQFIWYLLIPLKCHLIVFQYNNFYDFLVRDGHIFHIAPWYIPLPWEVFISEIKLFSTCIFPYHSILSWGTYHFRKRKIVIWFSYWNHPWPRPTCSCQFERLKFFFIFFLFTLVFLGGKLWDHSAIINFLYQISK